MCVARRVRYVFLISASLFFCLHSEASPLVTGNGFGFAVVSPQTGALTRFYAHPYSFTKPDPKDSLSEGLETANFVKSVTWSDSSSHPSSADYVEDSHVIHTRVRDRECFYFMPFGLPHDSLIIDAELGTKVTGGAHWNVEWSRPIKSQRHIQVSGLRMQLLSFDGIDESLLLIPLATDSGTARNSQHILATSNAWALIAIQTQDDSISVARDFLRWRAELTTKNLVKRELAEVERWRVKPTVHFQSDTERHLWRESEILLRVAQSREPNRPGRYNHGMIVACLPDGSWSMPWVRDMAYATAAFIRMGHREEARAAVLAYFNARPTGKMEAQTGGIDYQISVVRYFGDGSEEPFFTNEGSTNIEYDGWGLALWVLGEYVERFNDDELLQLETYRGTVYENAKEYIVKPLLATSEKYDDGLIVAADTSIWEERQRDKKHFAFSSAMAIVGLRNFAELAHRTGDERTRNDLVSKANLLQHGFNAAFIRDGKLRGTLEEGSKNDIDGALLAVINFGIVTDPSIIRSTVDRMERLKVASGGYRRVRSTYTDPSIYEYWYERQEFLFVDFSLAEVLRLLDRQTEADAILKRIVDKSTADHNFVPEMYVAEDCQLFHGDLGDPTGAIPMVGYGAGVYILDLLQRQHPSVIGPASGAHIH